MKNFVIFLFFVVSTSMGHFAYAQDTDGDTVDDIVDLDDDNDGILDVDEMLCGGPVDLDLATPIVTDFPMRPNLGAAKFTGSVTANHSSMDLPTGTSAGQFRVRNSGAGEFTEYEMTFEFPTDLVLSDGQGFGAFEQLETWTFTTDGPALHVEDPGVIDAPSTVGGTTTLYTGNELNNVVGQDTSTVSFSPATTNAEGHIVPDDSNWSMVAKGVRVLTIRVVTSNAGANVSSMRIRTDCVKLDPDSDGVANHEDYDSDNDSCVDGLESSGAQSYDNLSGNSLAGPVDMNAMSPTYGVPLVAGTGFMIGSSTDPSVQAIECNSCNSASSLFSDNDNDTIGDDCDVDDDNDGVLDTVECVELPRQTITLADFGVTMAANDGSINGTVDVSSKFGYPLGSVIVSVENGSTNTAGTAFTVGRNDLGTLLNTRFLVSGTIPVKAVVSHGSVNSHSDGFYSLFGGEYEFTAPGEMGYTDQIEGNNYYVENIMGDGSLQMIWASEGWARGVEFYSTRPQKNTASGVTLRLVGCADTDGDGVIDMYDFDSDNDQCPDGLESSGGLTYSDLTNNVLTGAVDMDPNSATYGLPVSAGTGFALGSSTDPALQSAECNPCDGGSSLFSDQDGDTIGDACDIDDDNDGIVDTVENNCSSLSMAQFSEDFENPVMTNVHVNNLTNNVFGQLSVQDAAVRFNQIRVDGTGYANGPDVANSGDQYIDISGVGPLLLPVTLSASGKMNASYFVGNWASQSAGYTAWDAKIQLLDASFNMIEEGPAFSLMQSMGQEFWQKVEFESSTQAAGDYYISFSMGNWGVVDDISVAVNGCDSDGDGVANQSDLDSDNDGIPDVIEMQPSGDTYVAPSGMDSNNDGLDDALVGMTPVNTDGVDEPDYLDSDSDNDGTPDIEENGNSNGTLAGTDADNDGIDDNFDTVAGGSMLGSPGNVTSGLDPTTGTDLGDEDGDFDPTMPVALTDELDYRDGTSAPDADDDMASVVQNTTVQIPVLANDSDSDGSLIISTLNITTQPTNGMVSVDSMTGVVTYTPSMDYTGTDSFVYEICDNDGACSLATVTITVAANLTDTDGDGVIDAVEMTDMTSINDPCDLIIASQSVMPTAMWNMADCDMDGVTNGDEVTNGTNPNDADSDDDGVTDGQELIDMTDPNNGCLLMVGSQNVMPPSTVWAAADCDMDGISNGTEAMGCGAMTACNTDGDAYPDYLDLDSDNDGIPDATECDSDPCENTDMDGLEDYRDIDSDDDGLTDAQEAFLSDVDGDGVVDDFMDANMDGANDVTASITPLDTNNDGDPDFLSTDSDGDGIPDATEGQDDDFDGTPDVSAVGVDTDGDGLDDAFDPDCIAAADCAGVIGTIGPTADNDLDDIPDYLDLDSDDDGILDSAECSTDPCEDTDMDGTADYLDLDSDEDGVDDSVEGHDADQDGVEDVIPSGTDTDSDGVDDAFDADCVLAADCSGVIGVPAPLPDTDMDGDSDFQDSDDDNDGILTETEIEDGIAYGDDPDNDGTPAYLDEDSDGDDVSDMAEGTFDPNTDAPWDLDNDGIPDYLDPDSAPEDTDGDGIPDAIECDGDVANCVDTDDDGILDHEDIDDDNDGILTIDETISDTSVDNDEDGDGIPSHLDLDSDGDGIDDLTEAHVPGSEPSGNDTDMDGLDDAFDTDNGGTDADETDTDLDGTPNYLDVDSDGDGVDDIVEGSPSGVASGTDTDGDGIDDAFDLDNGGTLPEMPDQDGDDVPDVLDTDDDNDGIDTIIEGTDDVDEDGLPNYLDIDSDGDGILDSVECTNAADCEDSETDGTPDYLDTDSDNDNVPDLIEGHNSDVQPSGVDADNNGLDDNFDSNPASTPDADDDGTPDFLDPDDDGDGTPTADEDFDGDGDPTNDDRDGDGVPDYLDPDDSGPSPDPIPGNDDDLLLGGGLVGCSSVNPGSSAIWIILFGLVLGVRRRKRN